MKNFVQRMRRFVRIEDGAVTVDWVVLTATLVALVLSLFTILTQQVYEDTAAAIADNIEEAATEF